MTTMGTVVNPLNPPITQDNHLINIHEKDVPRFRWIDVDCLTEIWGRPCLKNVYIRKK